MNELELFAAAIAVTDAAERAALLDNECAGRPDVRARLDQLLTAHFGSNSLLDAPAEDSTATHIGSATPTVSMPAAAETVGLVIAGRYKLLEEIGEGGMGTVWAAEQTQPVKRKVALKLIKAGMDSKTVLARFEAERQALAVMDHPNVAKVLDGGLTEAGRPYFVMEYVKGAPITEYCDVARLNVAERLGLFVQVCQAVQHAHQKGIIHRDLKPSNILVAPYDDRPVIKVIDFGLAKAMHQPLTERTLHTGHESVLGTPLYMSPEQAQFNNVDIDTRADIYSLGVLLYELLTGTTPLERKRFRQAAWDEVRRLIREEEPPKPSARLSSTDMLPSLAACRHTEPARLLKQVSGDLDWIVMKALEKDRGRRYETANAFAMDVQRFLSEEAIEARPPSMGYRAAKFVRRHRIPVAAACAVVLALTVGIVAAVIGLGQARTARQRADRKAGEAIASAKQAKLEKGRAERKAAEARRNLHDVRMNLAQVSWNASRPDKVVDLLVQDEPRPGEVDVRGFEWHYWNQMAHSYLRSFEGHAWPINGISFSPNGARLASASEDGTLRVWDVANDREALNLRAHTGHHHGLTAGAVFSPDGERVASAESETVAVFSVATGRQVLTLKPQTGMVCDLAFSPDGKWLAAAGSEGTVHLWEVANGRELHTMTGHTKHVMSVAFSPDCKRLASAGDDRTLRLWDPVTGGEVLNLNGHTDRATCVAFSPDGKWLASASWDGTARIWDAATGREVLTFRGHTGRLESVAFSPDGKRLASAGDNTVRLWDADNGHPTLVLRGLGDYVNDVVFSPDGTRLATASGINGRHWVRVWDAVNGQDAAALRGHTLADGGVGSGPVYRAVFSPDGKRLATAGCDGTLRIWDSATGRETLTLRGHAGSVHDVAFSPNGKLLATGGADRTVRVWDAATGLETLLIKEHSKPVNGVAFSPDGKRLASASDDGVVRLWDAATGQLAINLNGHTGQVFDVAFSPNGKWIASASWDQTLRVWDAASGQQVHVLKGHTKVVPEFSPDWPVDAAAFSPDSARIASAGWDGTVRLWDTASGQQTLVLRGHTGFVYDVAFSPNGETLASVCDDRTLRLWDAASGQETLTLEGQSFVAISPDGRRLATTNLDATVRVYDARPLTPRLQEEREALLLINGLRAWGDAQAHWVAAIEANPAPSEPVRQRAIRIVHEWEAPRTVGNSTAVTEVAPSAGAVAKSEQLLREAALQAWSGQQAAFERTCQAAIGFASEDQQYSFVGASAARLCSLLPSADKARKEQMLAFAKRAMQEVARNDRGTSKVLMAQGMAEFRLGNDPEAELSLVQAERLGASDRHVAGTSAFYRAMSLFRQGREAAAHELATRTLAAMKPLPTDQKNPLASGDHDDLILWMACKEAQALLKLDTAPAVD